MRKCLALLLAGMLIMPAMAQNTLQVGSGAGQYATIQAAIDDAANGDTIIIMDDALPYAGDLVIDKAVTIKPAPGRNPIITRNADSSANFITFAKGSSGAKLGCNSNDTPIKIDADTDPGAQLVSVFWLDNASTVTQFDDGGDLTLENLEIELTGARTAPGRWGIVMLFWKNHLDFSVGTVNVNNVFYDVGTYHPYAYHPNHATMDRKTRGVHFRDNGTWNFTEVRMVNFNHSAISWYHSNPTINIVRCELGDDNHWSIAPVIQAQTGAIGGVGNVTSGTVTIDDSILWGGSADGCISVISGTRVPAEIEQEIVWTPHDDGEIWDEELASTVTMYVVVDDEITSPRVINMVDVLVAEEIMGEVNVTVTDTLMIGNADGRRHFGGNSSAFQIPLKSANGWDNVKISLTNVDLIDMTPDDFTVSMGLVGIVGGVSSNDFTEVSILNSNLVSYNWAGLLGDASSSGTFTVSYSNIFTSGVAATDLWVASNMVEPGVDPEYTHLMEGSSLYSNTDLWEAADDGGPLGSNSNIRVRVPVELSIFTLD